MKRLVVPVLALVMAASPSMAASASPAIPTAIFAFEERGSGAKGLGAKASDIIFASLSSAPDLLLVDRMEIQKLLAEHEAALAGPGQEDQSMQAGQLVGAKILVAGSVVEADESMYLVAKVIGVETSRVLGESVKSKAGDGFSQAAEALAGKIRDRIASQAGELMAKELPAKDRAAAIREAIGQGRLPSVSVRVEEQHVGQPTLDPAAETEILMLCKEAGFELVGVSEGADVLIQGEGFSELALRRGNLVSVKARVELKAVERTTGRILAADRQSVVEVDLAEHIAGKKALQKAAAVLAERFLPKLAGK